MSLPMKIDTMIKLLENVKKDIGGDALIVFYWLDNHNLDSDCHFETIIPFVDSDTGNWVELTFGKLEDVSADSGTCGCCNRIDE